MSYTFAQENDNPHTLDSLLIQSNTIDSILDKSSWSKNNIGIGDYYYFNNDFDLAGEFYKYTIDFCNRHNLTQLSNKAQAYNARFLYLDSEYDNAIIEFNRILSQLTEKELETKGIVLDFLGRCLVYIGDFSTAYEKQIEALKIYKFLKDDLLLANIYYGIGNNYFYQGQHDLSLENFQNAYELYKKLDDEISISQIYGAFGSIYYEQKNYEEALRYNILYYESAKELKDEIVMGWALLNVGSSYEMLNQFDKATSTLSEGLELAKINEDISLEGYILEALAGIFFKEKKYGKALDYIDKSYKIAQGNNDKSNMLDLYKSYADLYSAKFDYENYEIYIDKYINLKDSLFNEESVDRISQISEQFKLEQIQQQNEINLLKKDKQMQRVLVISSLIILLLLSYLAYARIRSQREKNALLVKKNNEIINQYKILEDSNRDLQNYAKIISHDLKEPLRNISGFSTLLKRKINKSDIGNDEDVIEFTDFIINNTNQMNTLLSSLLHYSEITIREVNIEPINVKEEITSILENQNSDFIQHLDINIKTIQFDANQFRELIVQILDNAIKFKNEDKKLQLSIIGNDFSNYSEITINDNGIGIDKAYYESVFVVFKRLNDRATFEGAGVGLAICKKIIEMRGGSISITSEVNNGTTVHIKIPKELPNRLLNSIQDIS